MLICVILITNLSGRNYDYSHFTDEKKQGTLDKLAGIRIGSECWSWGLNQGVSLLASQAPAYCAIALCHPGFKGQGWAHSRLTSEDMNGLTIWLHRLYTEWMPFHPCFLMETELRHHETVTSDVTYCFFSAFICQEFCEPHQGTNSWQITKSSFSKGYLHFVSKEYLNQEADHHWRNSNH